MSPRPSVLSMVLTSKPSIAACRAQSGSISVTTTRAPQARMEWAQPLPTSPYPQTTTTLPASITSIARFRPSASDSRQPYRLSNLLLVTESLTLIAGTSSLPCSASWYRRCTPVVVSSETPFQPSTTVCQKFGRSLSTRLSRFLITCSSCEEAFSSIQVEPFSSSKPLWISRVTSPPSSTTSCGPRKPPLPSGKLSACSVQSQYSSSVSPFQANTGVPLAAIAAAAWSWVEKMLHEAQRTSAPMSLSVSISTA